MTAGCTLDKSEDTPASTEPPATTASPSAGSAHRPSLLVEAKEAGQPGEQAGSARVDLAISTLQGGEVRTIHGPKGEQAFRFPSYVATGTYPRAVVTVTNTGFGDALSPGITPFAWGADFNLDPRNEGRSNDNGNNLVQRGLFSDPTSFKAELDDGKPACTVHGDKGRLIVRSPKPVTPGTWYRMRCERDGSYLTVQSWEIDKPSHAETSVRVGAMGGVEMPSPSIPLSIGGKVGPNGAVIATATDQFNGAVANPFLDVGATEPG